MKRVLLTFYCVISLACAYAQRQAGVNLAAVRDWSSEFVFKDAFKMSREWGRVNLLNGSLSDPDEFNIPLRADGYPVALPVEEGDNTFGVRTFLFTDPAVPFPDGNYTLISEGRGMIRVRQSGGGSWQMLSSPGTYAVPKETNGHFIIDIMESEEDEPIHNIRFVLPGFSDSYEAEPFHPEFLSFLDNFRCIRFMDWMRTNGSSVVEWAHRTPVDYYTQALPYYGNVAYRGVAYEHMIELCNRLDKDAWINIPHMADDRYVTQLAEFLRDRLEEDLKIYVEYSNELWNAHMDFTQSVWVSEQGREMGYPGPANNQGRLFTAKRSADIFRIFENVFGEGRDRLVKVLAAQAGNVDVARTILDAFLNNTENVNPTGIGVDALAIAPYFANLVTEADDVDHALDQVQTSLDIAFQRIASHQNLLTGNSWNIPLIAYEGGQHLNGPNPATDAIFCEANRDERMGAFYCQYLTFWYENGGELFVHYNSVSACRPPGSWGLKEYTGQPDATAPKFQAVLECTPLIVNNNARISSEELFKVYPNPTSEVLWVEQLTDSAYDFVEILDLYGRIVFSSGNAQPYLEISSLPAGQYLLVLKRKGSIVYRERIIKM